MAFPEASTTRTMDLTPYDQIMLRQITRFLVCFKIEPCTIEDEVLDILRQGLARTVKQIPFLGGRVQYGDDRNMVSVVFEAGKNVQLQVTNLHKVMPNYETLRREKIPLSTLKESLLSPLPNFIHPKTKSQPILTVQANLLEGGLILCVCVHHSVIDGVGQGLLMTALAANCALASDPSNQAAKELTSQFDRIADEVTLRGKLFSDIKTKDIKQGHDFAEYHIPDPSTVSPIDNVVATPCTARLFFFSTSKLRDLKNAIMKACSVAESNGYISTNDAFGALAWYCVTMARLQTGKLTMKESSKLVVPIDCRTHLESSGLPKPYLGNACICLMPALPVAEITGATSSNNSTLSVLANLSQHIRSSIQGNSTAYILGLAHHANLFTGDINTMKPLMQSYLGPDVTYVSWAGFKLHDLDFGKVLGTMDYFRCPWRALDGVVKILPRGKDADWEVILEMETDVMDELLREDGEWMKWVDSVTH